MQHTLTIIPVSKLITCLLMAHTAEACSRKYEGGLKSSRSNNKKKNEFIIIIIMFRKD